MIPRGVFFNLRWRCISTDFQDTPSGMAIPPLSPQSHGRTACFPDHETVLIHEFSNYHIQPACLGSGNLADVSA